MDTWNKIVHKRGENIPVKNTLPWADFLKARGVDCAVPVVHAIDFHAANSEEGSILSPLSAALKGLKTRRERFGEFRGRVMSGMMRMNQHAPM